MPNWCMNNVSISGPKEKMQVLWGLMNEKQGLLEAMVPIGEWDYSRASEVWGTKWDVNTENLEIHEISGGRMEISGSFDSAWGPPIECFQTYLEANEDVTIHLDYFEPGMQFYGSFSRDGSVHEEFADISEVPDDIREDWNMEMWYEQDEDGEEE